jgi:hypothetical protein
MGQIVGPETLVFNLNQTPGNYLKEDILKNYFCANADLRLTGCTNTFHRHYK